MGGSERTGQVEMAEAVAHAFDTGEHLAVQAGTGTGKSLAYLVPAIARAVATDEPQIAAKPPQATTVAMPNPPRR